MANDLRRDDNWDAKTCGELCYSPATLVYQNGVDDLHGVVTLEGYLLEKNGREAYHPGLSIESGVGTNVREVVSGGTLIILDCGELTGGRLGSQPGAQSVLLLHAVGRRSGKAYTTPLSY